MRAAIYARISSTEQNELSIESQIAECRKYCEAKGYSVVAVFSEERSAFKSRRPVFEQVIEKAKRGEFDVIVCWNTSRFSRRRAEAARVKQELASHNIRVEFVSEPTMEGAEGVLMAAMLEGMAEYYSARISVEVRRSLSLKCQRGIYPGGKPPFGYILKDGHLYPHPTKAQTVQRTFYLYLQGMDGRSIARLLGVSKSRVYEWLRNPTYKGEFLWGGKTWQGIAEPLVSEEVWSAVQKIMEKRRGKIERLNLNYWLTGLLRCGYCGGRMSGCTVKKGGRYHHYYRCMNKCQPYIQKSKIETAVAKTVGRLLIQKHVRRRLWEKAKEVLEQWVQQWRKEMGHAKEQLFNINQRKERWFQVVEEGAPWSVVEERIRKLEEEEGKLKQVISEHERWLAIVEAINPDNLPWEEFAKRIQQEPQVIKPFIEKITVKEETAEVTIRLIRPDWLPIPRLWDELRMDGVSLPIAWREGDDTT